eukprot:Rhum_TRINITY_DN15052_c0_g1::Rhum_TRINITY_DN15052_c0_g1_i2::g.134985::m.134985
MRQILLASLAVLSAAVQTPPAPPSPSCEPACEEGKACRFGIGSDGQSCTTESVCVETVKRSEFCSEANAEKSCFSGTCADGLTCRERIVPGFDVEGVCVATCKVGEKVWKEGEIGPGAGDKWCNKQRCGSDGTMVPSGEVKDTCPVAKDLKCCANPPTTNKENHACCGTTGLWVLKDTDGRYACDEVVTTADVRVTPVAPFAHGCLGACGEGMDEGWEGTSPDPAQFCNTCRCRKGELTCTTQDCSKKMKCCPNFFDLPGVKCCGITGDWVVPREGEYKCGGFTVSSDEAKGVPFSNEKCPTFDPTSCRVGDETIRNGESAQNPHPALWCNLCDCNDGVATCTDTTCPKTDDLKCCLQSEKTLTKRACCGITGKWIGGGELCGGVKAKFLLPQTAAPFQSACEGAGECFPNTAVGGPNVVVPEGWSGPSEKAGASWCDTCRCSKATPVDVCVNKLVDGKEWKKSAFGLTATCSNILPGTCGIMNIRAPKARDYCCACGGGETQQGPGVTCTTIEEADCTIGCCPSEAPGAAEDYACCGISKKWVKKAADGTFTCGAHVTKSVDGEPFAKECEKTCKHTGAKDDAAAYLYTGWSGRDWGTNWCNMCRCKADGLACTTHTCKKRCCPKDDKPTDGSPVCCAATGKWIVPNSDGDLKCAHVVFKAGEDIGPVGEECSDPEQCTSDPVRNVGWRGAGTGADWCKTCKCAVVEDAPKYTCAGPVCPEQADLSCCDPALEPTDKDKRACCGITGDWVTTDADDITCGPVTIPHAADLAAPFNKACPTCSVTGLDDPVAVGWMGLERTAEKWCTKCHCIARGGAAELSCAARDCGELKCCAGAAPDSGDWACCGKTGEWVKKNGDDFTCDSVVSSKTDLPPFADKCADDAVCTDDEFDTPLAPGTVAWIGDDNCKMCHCSTDKKLTCRPARCVPLPP